MSNTHRLRALVSNDDARTLNALSALLDRVACEASTESPDAVSDAAHLLSELKLLIAHGRAAATRVRVENERRESLERERERRAEAIEGAAIMGVTLTPQPAPHPLQMGDAPAPEAKQTFVPTSLDFAAIGKANAEAHPHTPNPEAAKASEKWRAAQAERKASKKGSK